MKKLFSENDVVYIAGRMTGRALFNYHRFYGLAALIEREYHCTVLNPARQPHGLTYDEYIKRSMDDIRIATALVIMPGWMLSAGATREYREAIRLGKTIRTEYDVLCQLNDILRESCPGMQIGDIK